MKIYEKVRYPDGSRTIHLFGIKLFSYSPRKLKMGKSNIHIHGKGNEVINANPCNSHLTINIYGKRNRVIINTDQRLSAIINVGTFDCSVSDCEVVIGKDTTSNGLFLIMLENGSKVHIGEDCMFSDQVQIWASDTHSIISADDGRLLNEGKSVEIGDHCWIGYGCRIMKNSLICPNTVVGMGSIVAGKQTESNCVITGVPAKVVKRGINWDRRRPHQYTADMEKQQARN